MQDQALNDALESARTAWTCAQLVFDNTQPHEFELERPEHGVYIDVLKAHLQRLRDFEHSVQQHEWQGWARGATAKNASLAHAFVQRAELPALRLVEAHHVDPERTGNTSDPRAILGEAWEKWNGLWCPPPGAAGNPASDAQLWPHVSSPKVLAPSAAELR